MKKMKKSSSNSIIKLGFGSLAILLLSGCSIFSKKDSNYKKAFGNSIIKQCVSQPANDIYTNKPKFCSCIAKSYTNRYDDQQLAQINAIAGGPNSIQAQVIKRMMSPELQKCENKYQLK